MSKQETTSVVSLRIPERVLKGISRLAERDERSTAEYIRIVLSRIVDHNEFKVKA